MSTNPFVTWALRPLPATARVAVVAGPGAEPGDVELVAAEIADALDGQLTDPPTADLVVRAHRGAVAPATDRERDSWPQARRIATWSITDRVVTVGPADGRDAARRRAEAAHALRAITVRGRGLRRRWAPS